MEQQIKGLEEGEGGGGGEDRRRKGSEMVKEEV